MLSYKFQTTSVEETMWLAEKLGEKLQGGEIIILEGDLGAGKTHFVKGLARGLAIQDLITSPTFTLLQVYEGRLSLAHFDLYRLTTPTAFEELGYEEYFTRQTVAVIEWGALIQSYLPPQYLQIEIKHNLKGRLIAFFPHGESWQTLVKELADDVGFGY